MAPAIFSICFAVIVLFALVHGVVRGSVGMRWVCILLLAIIFFMALVQWPHPASRERARRTLCMYNLKQIAVSAMDFRADHSNAFPRSVLELTNTLSNPKLFICRSTGHEPGALADVLSWTDYVILLPPATNQIVAFCQPGNHRDEGGNIAFTDGAVRWFGPEEFRQVLAEGRQDSVTPP